MLSMTAAATGGAFHLARALVIMGIVNMRNHFT